MLLFHPGVEIAQATSESHAGEYIHQQHPRFDPGIGQLHLPAVFGVGQAGTEEQTSRMTAHRVPHHGDPAVIQPPAEARNGSLDLAVQVADSTMSHRSRFAIETSRATVIDLLVLDPMNPRAIMCQLNDIRTHIEFLPLSDVAGKLSPLQRQMLQIHTGLALHTPEDLTTEALHELGEELASLSTKLAADYLA